MSKKNTTPAENDPSINGGAGKQVKGVSFTIEELTPEQLMAFPPESKPTWPEGRYPVNNAEYEVLLKKSCDASMMEKSAAAQDMSADNDVEMELSADFPEDDEPSAENPSLAAITVANFDGIPATGWNPPDCTVATGLNHVMVSVNSSIALYNKNGTLAFNWGSLQNFFSPVMPAGVSFIFDPVISYDHYSNRYIVVAVVRSDAPNGSWIMLGVSKSSNPLGGFWLWATNAKNNGSNPTNNWADYPMLGFDGQCIYVSTNQFAFGGGFAESKVRIFHKPQVYAGGVGAGHNITWYDYWGFTNPGGGAAFTIQPCAHYRGIGGTPPAYFVNAIWPSSNKLTMWTLNNPAFHWIGGAGSWTKKSVTCRAYNLPPKAEQKGSATLVATNDSRLLRAIYQNAGGVQRIWCCQTSVHTWAGDTKARSVIQWYEINVPTATVVQQNAYGAKGFYYFFPSIQTDLARNAYLVFGRCNSSEFIQLRQTGRKVTGPLNDMQNSALLSAGSSANTSGRWGDYFAANRDPSNTLTVWLYGGYMGLGGQWKTRIASVKF